MKSGEVIIMRTDKSSKLSITDVDTFLKIKNGEELSEEKERIYVIKRMW